MNNLKFRTVLGICGPKSFKHDILVFTRGATATITYDLGNKFYNLDSIDQITFIFKQGLNTFYFNMLNYLRETADTEAVEDKVYYDVYEIDQETKQCKAAKIVDYTGNPKAAGYYELVTVTDDEDNLCWMPDEHFYLLDNVLTFTMFPEETTELALTSPMNNMKFEIVFRLDTNSSATNNYRDSIIIEPQHPIAVVDSLYSQITHTNGLTVSTKPGSLASTNKTVKK